jgi:hypothetical protein
MKHSLEPDVQALVTSSDVSYTSSSFVSLREALSTTSAATRFDLAQLPQDLLVTRDFHNTVQVRTGDITYVSDSYMRPVQWVLSVAKEGSRQLVVISPFEANELLPLITKSKHATLHLYVPRLKLRHKPLDSLNLYCVGLYFDPSCLDRNQIVQLNLFAGQLYFRTYQEYMELCEKLGLAWTAVKEKQTVLADGFIQPPAGQWGFQMSPVRFLRELFRIRRQGEGIEKTQMGKVLDGTLLEEGEFA